MKLRGKKLPSALSSLYSAISSEIGRSNLLDYSLIIDTTLLIILPIEKSNGLALVRVFLKVLMIFSKSSTPLKSFSSFSYRI